jgi:hypothetical protein
MALGALGTALASADRHSDAGTAWHEGLTIIVPFIEAHATAFDHLARTLGRDYLSACAKSGTKPDYGLLVRTANALKR